VGGDFTYVATWQGFVYMAFIIDALARRIVGWRVSRTAHASFVLDALEQALRDRWPVQGSGLIHHSDRGVQYVSIHHTERLAQAGIERSVGGVRDSYDDALAETVHGLFKTEVICSSVGGAHGVRCSSRVRHSRMGSTGSTIVASSSRSAMYRQPRLSNATATPNRRRLRWRR
jgi:transposase InsO family protein